MNTLTPPKYRYISDNKRYKPVFSFRKNYLGFHYFGSMFVVATIFPFNIPAKLESPKPALDLIKQRIISNINQKTISKINKPSILKSLHQ